MKAERSVLRIVRSWTTPLACALALGSTSLAQVAPLAATSLDVDSTLQSSRVEADGFGEYEAQSTPCLTDGQRLRIQGAIASNQRMLRASSGSIRTPFPLMRFGWPVIAVGAAAEEFGVHGISNFVDQDPTFPGNLLDYNCGARTYDVPSGYNHRGIDIFTWPRGWTWMDNEEVQIVAAAAGTIVLKQGGNFDESCSTGGGQWNAVYVEHADGSVAWYGHMKNGSLTTKPVGERVQMGEYLGVIGSSGNSTGPHLHFEVYDRLNRLLDPFGGPCNSKNPRSLWLNQRPYYDSHVLSLLVGHSPAVMPTCPGRMITNEAMTVPRGTTGVFTAFYRDQLNTQTSMYRILRPGGTVYQSWNHSSSVPHYAASWWYWTWSIPPGAPTGTWTFEVTFDGRVYSKPFDVS